MLKLLSAKLSIRILPWLLAISMATPVVAQVISIPDGNDIRLARQLSPTALSAAVVLDDGHRIALLGTKLDGTILTVHETLRGQTLATVQVEERCSPMRVLAEAGGKHVALIGASRICRFTLDGVLSADVAHPVERAVSATFSRDGSLLALGNGDGDLALLDWPSGRVRWHRTSPSVETYAVDLAFTADARAVVVCCGSPAPPNKATVAMVDVETGNVIRRQPGNGVAVAVSPDGRSFGILGNRLQILSLPDLKPIWSAPTIIEKSPHVDPIGYVARPTPLHYADGGWYFVNSQRQLVHATEAGHSSALIATDGPAILAENSGPMAWVAKSVLKINKRTVALPSPLDLSRTAVALSANKRWLLVSKGDRLQRFDLLHGFSTSFRANTGFAPSVVGINNLGNFSSWTGISQFARFNRELADRPRKVLSISNNGDTMLAQFANGTHWRNVATGSTLELPLLAEPVASHADTLLYKAQDGTTHCVNLQSGTDRLLPVKINIWDRIAFTPNGRNVALNVPGTTEDPLKVELWSCDTGERIASLTVASAGLPWVVGNLVAVDESRLLLKNISTGQESYDRWYIGNIFTGELRAVPAELGEVMAVAEGRAIGVMPDQTVRITDIASGQVQGVLSLHEEDNWLVVGPNGRFDTPRLSDNSAIRWILQSRPLEPVPMEAFYRDRYEPNLLAKLWRNEALRPLPPLQARNLDRPEVSILAVQPTGPALVDVEVAVSSTGQAGSRELRLARDGVLVGSLTDWPVNAQVPYRHIFRGVRLRSWQSVSGATPTILSAWAFNADGVRSATATKTIGAVAPASQVQRRAFLLTIGVNWHDNPAWSLSYAVNDAQTLAKTLESTLESSGRLVHSTSLLSVGPAQAQATKARIRDAIRYLSGHSPAEQTKPEGMLDWPQPGPDDLVFISFSGHGFATDNGEFFLVPQDTGVGDTQLTNAALQARSIGMAELYQWIEGLDAAKVVIVLDACNSSSAIMSNGFRPGAGEARSLGQLAYEKGISVLAAAAGDQSAFEINSLQHGLVTWVLAEEGLNEDRANTEPVDRTISLREWLQYAVSRTPEVASTLLRGGPTAVKLVTGPIGTLSQLRAEPSLQQPVLFDYGSGDIVLKLLK